MADERKDKITIFAAEQANPATDPEEQIMALKFLLHFIGDLHGYGYYVPLQKVATVE
jgi:hypothetical protein